MIEAKTLCQSCIERGLEPHEAIGLWQGFPICDECLKPLIENQMQVAEVPNQEDLQVTNAINFVEQLETLFSDFPIASEAVLKSHDDFYNHRALANVNIPLAELEKIIDRRKSIIFALNRRNEPDVLRLQQIKREEREKVGLVNIEKSKSQKDKPPSAIKKAQVEKLAKTLGLSVAQFEAMGKEARQREFAGVLNNDKQTTRESPVGEKETTKGILSNIQARIQSDGTRTDTGRIERAESTNKITGKRCQTCGKFTCIC